LKQSHNKIIFTLLLSSAVILLIPGCGGYSNSWPYREDVKTVYVEMFDTTSFRRGHEFVFTDALCKRIEAQTPYKIVTDRNTADTILSGSLGTIKKGILTMERESGKPLENEAIVSITVNWKDLSTGDIIINNEVIYASTSYSTFLNQDYDYAADVSANKAAQRVVELMQNEF